MSKQIFVLSTLISLGSPLWAAETVIEPVMMTIPAGQFLMGGEVKEPAPIAGYPVESPIHQVSITAFKLAKYEVTVKEFRQFIDATGRKTDDQCWRIANNDWGMERAAGQWNTPAYAPSDYHPVMCVSWDDAKAYAQWLSTQTGKQYRLPSEAEWEYAARAGNDTSYHFGEDPTELCRYANIGDRSNKAALLRDHDIARTTFAACDDGAEYTTVVGTYEGNAFGLHDLIGNASEWVEDCQHITYTNAPDDGSAWTRDCDTSRGAMRIRRGASYHSGPLGSRSSWRGHGGQTNTSSMGEGIRLAQDIQVGAEASCRKESPSNCDMTTSNNPFVAELIKAQEAERKRRKK